MPGVEYLLSGLSEIANRATAVAIAWHVAIAMAIVALFAGWRPPQRTARWLITLLFASVAAVSFVFGNLFNGAVFVAVGAAMMTRSAATDRTRVTSAGSWLQIAGLASIAFGWVYPHFLAGDHLAYLYASPVGLVPCPTLAVAIGFALLGGGLGSRAWSLILAGVGIFYGVFGVIRLGVMLDVGLVGGAIVLLVATLRSSRQRANKGSRDVRPDTVNAA